ncbi:centrosome-associated protein 350 isoform X2 [Hemicordylus capensis]|uniref:centrosome-associated protein 350 isoform X2 n=1 Tax=Hemicordylus capensis TaxID=884348 RepID=UPI002303C85C|nr:centrosome-associated protein 350 isoform X2 [Hemicordylus capensis]
MWSNKPNEVPLQNTRSSQSRDSIRDLTTVWDAFSQTKAALRHIENKLEVAPTSTAVLDSVMDAKKPSASTTRKISRRACRTSSQLKERFPRSPLRATTLDSNVKKSGHVEFREPLASFRDTPWSPSYKTSCQLEARCLKRKEAGNNTEGMSRMAHEKDEPDLDSRNFKSSSSINDIVVRYLNDRPAIDALQSSDAFFKAVTPTRSEEEKTEGSRADDNTGTSLSTATQDTDLKELHLAESSASSASTSSAHRLDILKQRQNDAKLEKLKERIRKQWEQPEELSSRGHHLEYADHPVIVATAENAVTPKVRKVATAPPAPSYKGFNPSEAKIRTPDGKVWREEEFLSLSRELCRDLELQLAEEDSAEKEASAENRKERKANKPVRKIQKMTQPQSPDLKLGGTNAISTSSWRDGQRLAKKFLGPAPKIEHQNKQPSSSDRIGGERSSKSEPPIGKTESDPKIEVIIKPCSRSPDRSRSKVRAENNLKKKDSALQDTKQGEDHVNKDFLPVEIRGILDDLELDYMSQNTKQEREEDSQIQISAVPSECTRSHSPTKRKPDKLAANEEPQVISKKRHYDTDEVRQYIVKQQEERKKKQSEEKKAQKEATEQKNKRLQELYKKQREALTNKTKSTLVSEIATKQLQETYSKLFLEQTLLEDPLVPVPEPKPGYQPSGESDKENKAQERPPSASSSSDMSLSEPPHSLVRKNLLEPLWMKPDRLSSKAQFPCSQPPPTLGGSLFSQLLTLDHMGSLKKDFDPVLSTRRSQSTAVGSIPLASASAVQPTINQYKSKLDRIEALKATAASLSSRIESEAKKLAGAGINYGAAWNSEQDLPQGDQGDGCFTKAGSPPVKEDDVFSARLQKMLGTCVSHTNLDDNLPGVGNLNEFKNLPETISPHSAAVGFPGNHRPEGILGKKQTCAPDAEIKVVVPLNCSVGSISEGSLSDGHLSEEETEQHEFPPLKTVEILKEKEFCVADKTEYEPIKEFQKEAEKHPPIFTQMSASKPWEELTKGSPHSVINIFTKSYQLGGKGLDELSGQGSPNQRPLLPVMSPPASIVSYDDDFISSQGSGAVTDKKAVLEPSSSSSSPSMKEEFFSRKSPYELQATESPYHSSGPPSAGSSRSSASSKRRRGKESKSARLESFSGISNVSLREENKTFPVSDRGLQQTKNSLLSNGVSNREQEQNLDSDSTLEELSAHSLMSLPDKIRSPRTVSSPQSPSLQKQLDPVANTAEKARSSSNSPGATTTGPKPNPAFSDMNLGTNRTGAGGMNGSMRFSPAGLQHRLSAELNYLTAIEESVRQISDVERVRGISLAQQESVSLAQILKAQQQRHERDLALLKLKAEQEALESQRQLEEARQKAAQAHAESLQQLVQSRQEAAEALQEAACKMTAQQMEAALLTTDAARQIREMTELARAQISDRVGAPAAPITTLFDQGQKHHTAFIKQLKAHAFSRKIESITSSQNKEETTESKRQYSPSFDSYSESSRSKAHDQSSSSSRQESPSVPSSKETKKLSRREKPSASIAEEAPTAVNDSLQSNGIPLIHDERDSTSVATEYSLKFDESMTEDEIEERSFRSLLPSESHRRINLKKRDHQDYSDEDASPAKSTISPIKELSLPFSGGQDSFSRFTMEMVRQYMKEEEMRAAHQSSLLRLREKALKEKTKAELAWLEHQKRRLRDKGEDDKMPPIRKKQRGLLLKLQQEKAEIKRLQEASKAARKERQLILKQQEEIERIRQTTMKLQEKLKSAGENKLEHRSEDDVKQTHSSSPLPTDAETCSPSSISSSETSSIMQKLKKMRSRMDEKHCSPVHYFFSVFTSHHWASLSVCFPNLHPKFQLYIYNQLVRFLTKREQKLMQRRQHAEELLKWKRRLDAEEAEIRQIEKQALAAWDKELLKAKANKKAVGDQKSDQKETGSEEDSSVPPCSRLNSESSVPEELGSLVVEPGPSKVSEEQEQLGSPDHTTLTEAMVYTQDLVSTTSPGKLSPSKSSASLSKQESSKGTHRTGEQQHLPTKSQDISYSWSDESLSMTQSETTSDQSDIESRIRALKDELQKRKSVVYQLKKEQKKRHKERLKAQEASLLKQLETYDEFIKKTEAELSRDLEATPTAKPQIKTPSSTTEKPKIKPPPLHRSETTKNWKSLTESERSRSSLESIAEHVDAISRSERSVSAYTKKFIEAEIRSEEHSQTPSPLLKVPKKTRAESGDSVDSVPSLVISRDLGDGSKTPHVSINKPEDATNYDSFVSTNRFVLQEEVESVKSECETEIAHKTSERSDASVFDIEQKSSPLPSLKTAVSPEAEPLEMEQIALTVVCLQDRKEMSKDDEAAVSIKSSLRLNKELLKEDPLFSDQIICKELSYSNDFEESSSRQDTSKDKEPLTEYCKDDFDVSELPLGKDSGSCGEKSWYTRTPRSRSLSIGSDDEISEYLSDKSLSVAGSIHSERLLELKSPTELMKSKERSDVEKEPACVDSSVWTSSSKTEEEKENALLDFSIGDRVLVSNVQPGTLRFKGLTNFAKGFWAGVELDKPEGNNNGTYDGTAYFDCKEKHGIFAPPQKISLISASFDLDTNEDSFCKHKLDHHHKADQTDSKSLKEEKYEAGNEIEKCSQDKSQRSRSEDSFAGEDYLKLTSQINHVATVAAAEDFAPEQSITDSLKSSLGDEDNGGLSASISNAHREASTVAVEGIVDSTFPEKLKQQHPSWQEYTEKSDSLVPSILEKSATPLLDLLTKERSQLEAQLRVPSQEEKEPEDQQEKVGLLTDSLLQAFVKDTVNQLQQIKKVRNEKIQSSNQELCAAQEKKLATRDLQSILISSELDDGEEVSSPDMCPRPESPVFGASGQEELAKRLAELELSREFLSVLDDQDWFDEDFGLSSRKLPQKQAEESAVLPKIEPPKVPPKPCEEPLAVPHTAEEVEVLVHTAAEELWKCKELGHDLQATSLPRDTSDSPKENDIESISKQIYKQAVFDLTREIFGEIFAEDPNLNQPIWMKPCRITSTYFRRVKDPSDLEEIKSFIATEVLKLLNLKKELNNKTDWQKMMKFGRKKRDRVDHILVQELHEEEAQWVNYDEDELYVKMQLADGIFEALIRETIDIINQISEKQERLLPL